MNFNVFAPKYPISAQFGYNFSRQTDSGAGSACFCHILVMSLPRGSYSAGFGDKAPDTIGLQKAFLS